MNIFLIIILSSILIEYLLNTISGYLNLQRLNPKLPKEFDEYYDADEYQRSQEYTHEKTRFGFKTSTFNLVTILAVILLGGFNYIDVFVLNLGYSSIVSGLLFFGILLLIQDIISTPISLYHTFVIEEKFGFNKMTYQTYLSDKLKGYLLMILIGVPILATTLYVFENVINAWLVIWGFFTILQVIMPKIYTQFIAPLFNTFTPLELGDLRNDITAYSQKVDFPLTEIFVMDGSRRSGHSNAYFTGFGKNKRIVLFDTLMKDHSNPEIMAILAHEVGHYKKRHILKGMAMSIIHLGIMLYIMQYFITSQELHRAFGMTNDFPSIYAGLLFFSLLYSPIEIVLSIFFNYFSRKHEFEADQYSKDTIESSDALISGLKNLAVKNLSNLTPHPLPVFLSYSHPPVLERIKEIKK